MPKFSDIFDKSLRRLTQPATEPLTVTQAKAHCSITSDVTDFDDQFREWIRDAREKVEDDCERAFVAQKWELAMERFPAPQPYFSGNLSPMPYNIRAIELRRPPVTAINSLVYYDQTGTLITMVENTDFLVNYAGDPCLVTPPVSNLQSGSQLAQLAWPPCLPRVRGVVVTFTTGYDTKGDSNMIPGQVRQAMRMLIGHWWRNREATNEKPAKAHDLAYAALIANLSWRD